MTEVKKRTVHRDIHLTSPLAQGADVRALQEAMDKTMAHEKLPWERITPDAQAGHQTIHLARFDAFVQGLGPGARDDIRRGVITQEVQTLLRHPEKRNAIQKARAEAHKPKLRDIRKGHRVGPAAAVKAAHAFLGVTESPAGSNSGPEVKKAGLIGGISHWEAEFGFGACYWCGCFSGSMVKVYGGVPLTSRVAYCPYIEVDAAAGVNGMLRQVSVDQARPGDLITYTFGAAVAEHVELCVGPTKGGEVHTIGGNTSSDSAGSQSNGGGVFEKHRPASEVHRVCRPDYGRFNS